jgi:hypothetical protein
MRLKVDLIGTRHYDALYTQNFDGSCKSNNHEEATFPSDTTYQIDVPLDRDVRGREEKGKSTLVAASGWKLTTDTTASCPGTHHRMCHAALKPGGDHPEIRYGSDGDSKHGKGELDFTLIQGPRAWFIDGSAIGTDSGCGTYRDGDEEPQMLFFLAAPHYDNYGHWLLGVPHVPHLLKVPHARLERKLKQPGDSFEIPLSDDELSDPPPPDCKWGSFHPCSELVNNQGGEKPVVRLQRLKRHTH